MTMVLTLICVVVLVLSLTTIFWKRRSRDQRWTMEQHAISPEQLYSLLGAHQDVALFDVRQSLDLLAHSEIIPALEESPRLMGIATEFRLCCIKALSLKNESVEWQSEIRKGHLRSTSSESRYIRFRSTHDDRRCPPRCG